MKCKLLFKHSALFITGGVVYVLLELLFRSRSHWTMFLLGGTVFTLLGLINEIIPWSMPLLLQMCIGSVMITTLEFTTGCIVNLVLDWAVWDYSELAGNILGQICPLFSGIWFLLSAVGIILDDWLRYWFFREEKPRYKIL